MIAKVESCVALKDVLRALESAKLCIEARNFGMAKDHLSAAVWHAIQAKKAIAVVGQAKNQKIANVLKLFQYCRRLKAYLGNSFLQQKRRYRNGNGNAFTLNNAQAADLTAF